MQDNVSPLKALPTPRAIHAHMGKLYRELSLLRRLLRLAQTVRDQSIDISTSLVEREVPLAR